MTTTSSTIIISITNNTSNKPKDIYIMLHGGSSADGQLKADNAVCLDKLKNSQFTLESGSGVSRIYISFDKSVTVGEPFNSSTRFDWVELTYVPPGVSQANLTAVDQFGIPLAIEAIGTDSGTKKWIKSANDIIADLTAIAPKAVIQPGNAFVRVQAPQQTVAGVYTTPDWSAYLSSLSTQSVTIKDNFSEAGQDPIFIDYSGTFQANGTITLSGSLTQSGKTLTSNHDITVFGPASSLPKPPSGFSKVSFADQIYEANGPYFRSDDPTIYHTAGENNVYSVIYRDLISGLQNGFIGGKFGNSTDDWAGNPSFAAARSTKDGFYNHYAAAIEADSGGNIYGYAFSDNTAHPLLTITNSSELKISILSDTQVL